MFEALKTKVGEVELATPLLLASGYITETPDFFLKTDGCAGMVTRSLKEQITAERLRTPAPRYVVFDDGKSMLNCEWGGTVPWETWIDSGLMSAVKDVGGTLVMSLSGREIEGCAHLIEEFDKQEATDAFEINVSCSHSGAVHGNLNIDVMHLEDLLRRIRPLTKKPIWIKLSYSSVLLAMAKKAEELGADAIVCSNSIGPGMFIDVETGLPKLGIKGGAGGMTGRALFPIALNCVYQLAQTVKIPIVGAGGVATAEDVIQMMMAGASAVQLYTAPALQGPEIFSNIRRVLLGFLASHVEYERITDLIGVAIGKAEENVFWAPKPKTEGATCIGCGSCRDACAFGALWLFEDGPDIDHMKCVGCNACVGACLWGVITTKYERSS